MANYKARILCLMAFLINFIVGPSLATDYTVGDSAGWALGADYTSWTSGKTFTVGDSLVFKYTGSSHTVDEVTANDYNTCSVGNSISSDSTGSTTIALKTPGPHYFICGVVGHCGGGMKLSVTVTAAGGGGGAAPASPPAASETTTSPPSTTTSPAPPTTTTTTLPPPSATATNLPSSCGTLSSFSAMFFTFVAMLLKLVLS
ncbi:hypothetical protein ACH5RR_034633 [Cinchona calisaya]|uniref:Phytocyanin domain-containing protein n=1 Tax=Cinchona calisaya TaxID=153742 RepID=A0ABD2YBH3_9GENT